MTSREEIHAAARAVEAEISQELREITGSIEHVAQMAVREAQDYGNTASDAIFDNFMWGMTTPAQAARLGVPEEEIRTTILNSRV